MRASNRRRALAALVALSSALAPVLARAQSAPPGAAAPAPGDAKLQSRAAFASGARALEEGRAKEALALFQEAYRLFPHYATWYNIGLCERALGHPVEAHDAFVRFLDEGGAEIPPAKVDATSALVKEAQGKIAKVTVSASVAEASVTVDGDPIGPGPARANPGEHVAEASAPGYAPAKKRFDLPPGGELTVRLDLERLAPAPPVAEAGGPRLDAIFWATAAVSAGALVAGAITGGIALSDSSAYADPATPEPEAQDRRSRGEALRVVADVCFGAAIVGGGAAVLLATLRSPDPPARAAVTLRPAGLGLEVGGSF